MSIYTVTSHSSVEDAIKQPRKSLAIVTHFCIHLTQMLYAESMGASGLDNAVRVMVPLKSRMVGLPKQHDDVSVGQSLS